MVRLLPYSMRSGSHPLLWRGCRSFEPKGISHWIWLLWLPARLWSLTKQTVVRRWQISTASLELSSHYRIISQIPKAFMPLGTKTVLTYDFVHLCLTQFVAPQGRWRWVMAPFFDQWERELQDQVLHPGLHKRWLLCSPCPAADQWVHWPLVKQEKRSPLLAFFV